MQPLCKCGKPCEKNGNGYRKLCWKCRQYRVNPEAYLKRKKEYVARLKRKAIDGYGGECSCCGEKEILFLSIDHVNNDGNKHRKESNIHTGAQTYKFVVESGFPKEFQVLCFNCNWGKHANDGVCPHKMVPCGKV
jgi:hypothetical protein